MNRQKLGKYNRLVCEPALHSRRTNPMDLFEMMQV
jgi:hypothetical protein